MKSTYLYLGLIISCCCSSTDEITLEFPTVENITVSSQRIDQNNTSIVVEGIVHSNESEIEEMYLVWNDYFTMGGFDKEYNPQNFANKKKFQWQDSGEFIVPDTVTTSVYFSIFVKSSTKNAYSDVFLYHSAIKTLEKVTITNAK